MAKSLDRIHEMVTRIYRHREGGSPFEVAVNGYTGPGDAGLPHAYEVARANWWLKSIHGMRGDLDEMVARVREGPPGYEGIRATEQDAQRMGERRPHR